MKHIMVFLLFSLLSCVYILSDMQNNFHSDKDVKKSIVLEKSNTYKNFEKLVSRAEKSMLKDFDKQYVMTICPIILDLAAALVFAQGEKIKKVDTFDKILIHSLSNATCALMLELYWSFVSESK